MCGICGYTGVHRPEILEPMGSAMWHRGPDDHGTWHDAQARIGLGHQRLSIIDLSAAGHQPMTNSSKTIWLTYNGEIYNFQEHRWDLIKKGYSFKSHSDTEVLIALYERYGLDCLQKLNGIFAFALWDSRTRELILARDHAGIKPLYYCQNGRELYFASEIKALLRIPEIPRELNISAVPQYLTFLWVPGEETMLKGIRKIEPGHCLIWKDGETKIKKWFSLNYLADETIPEQEWVSLVHDAFMETTRRQMISDAPLGAFLSGGLDSSSIAACMRKSFPGRDIHCYTFRYASSELKREGLVDDFPYAQKVAQHFDLKLKSMALNEDIFKLLPKITYHLDEPDADPAAILSYLIAEMARQDGIKVLLSGTGGDEVFFGYRSHQAYRIYENFNGLLSCLAQPLLGLVVSSAAAIFGAQGALARRALKFQRGLSKSGLARHLELVDWSSPETRRRVLSQEFNGSKDALEGVAHVIKKYYDDFKGRGELHRHSYVLIQTFLAAHNFLYMDKAAMAASVETRVPFMDVDLLKLAACIPERLKIKNGIPKYLFRKAMAPYLPKEILTRPKTGFGPPLKHWMAHGMEGIIHEFLSPDILKKRGLIHPGQFSRLWKENRENKADHAYLIYALLTLEIWMQTFIDRPGVEIVTNGYNLTSVEKCF